MTKSTSARVVRLLSPSAMGRTNRSRVLQLLLQHGPSSRAELARALGVNRATIAAILQPLVQDQTLVEGDKVAASPAGGKPSRPLWFNRTGSELGTVRMASDRIDVARLSMEGRIRIHRGRAIDPGWSLERISQELLDVSAECFEGHPLVGIGVAAAGMVDTSTGTILSLHLAPVMNGFAVGKLLSDRFATAVTVDHHPRVLALGDKWFGLGRGLSDFASVYTGEALGMGIVHEGEVFRGLDGAGGEYGHVVVQLGGELCLCGRRGCWETLATVAWLRREAVARGLAGAADLSCAILSRRADDGDQEALELLELYATHLAVGLANHEQILASRTYIMHGDVVGGGERMRMLLEDRLDEASPRRGATPTVLLDTRDADTVLLGGGGLVLSSELSTTA